ncbi:MAG: energy-coupling factor transporter transmembrane protein EcfT [Chloroflexi bacterium]|nr:energy-coupling factor transporter transmembrane protein EcfT [Chloroflexota bacterium]
MTGLAPAAKPASGSDRLPEYIVRVPSGLYVGLNPTTKLVIALGLATLAFVIRGWTGPVSVFGAVLLTVVITGVGRRLVSFVVASLPLVISILLINTFIYPDATDALATVGPFTVTGTGLTVALQAALRVIAFALAIGVFVATTDLDDLLSDLERRGLGRRAEFVIGSAIRMVPRMVERAGEIVEAQRARGLDTEGRPWRRARGLVPLAGPMIGGALNDVEERTMALEARAFSAPARRTPIRRFPDSAAQRAARWGLGLLIVALTVATVGGWLNVP